MSNDAITWAFRQPVGSPARMAVLVALANMADDLNACWPSQETLACMTNQCVRSVHGHLKALEQMDLIRRQPRYVNGRRTSDRYVLAVDLPATVAGSTPEDIAGSTPANPADMNADKAGRNTPLPEDIAGSATGKSCRVNQRTTNPKDLNTSANIAKIEIDAAFAAFWAVYPRKEKRLGARRDYERALGRLGDTEKILAGAVRYRDDPNRDPTYTKQPSTWLNNDCWDDDPLPGRGAAATKPGRPDGWEFGR